MPRLKILSAAEQDEFDSPPLLSGDSRKAHFRFNQILQAGPVLRTRVFGTSGLKFVSIGKCRKT
jgi:hypothetical protein